MTDDEIDLRDLLLVLWRNRRLIVGIFLVVVVAGGAVSMLMPSVYRASCVIALGNFGDPIYTNQSNVVEYMQSDGFMLKLVEYLNLSISPSEFSALKDSIKIEPVKGSNSLLRISIETTDPAEGRDIAIGMAQLLLSESEECYLKQEKILLKQLNFTEEQLAHLDNIINQTRETLGIIEGATGVSPLEKSLLLSYKLDYLQSASSQRLSLSDRYYNLQKQLAFMRSAEIVEAPVDLPTPVRPKRLMIIAVAGMLGLMMGVFAAFLREALGRRE